LYKLGEESDIFIVPKYKFVPSTNRIRKNVSEKKENNN
jgi:hypothetical protein